MTLSGNITVALAAALILSGCEQVMNAPATVTPLDSKPNVTTIDRYFSRYTYGPLLRLYDFRDQRVILKVKISNESRDMPLSASLYTFADGVSEKAIEKWINNQHSDALYADAAEPASVQDLSDRVSIFARTREASVSGREGEAYQRYAVSYRVGEIKIAGVAIGPFNDDATVHVRLSAN